MFGVFQRSGNSTGESSDEDLDDDGDDENSADRSLKGVVIFNNVQCLKTNVAKTFHLILYSSIMYQYSGKSKKKYYIKHIQRVRKQRGRQVSLDVKRPSDFMTRQKLYEFENESRAEQFKKYVENLLEKGALLRHVFDKIDFNARKFIQVRELEMFSRSMGYELSDRELRQM